VNLAFSGETIYPFLNHLEEYMTLTNLLSLIHLRDFRI
jgi:hypothetical protein